MDRPGHRTLATLQLLAPMLVSLFVLYLLGWDTAFSTTVPAFSDLTGHYPVIEVLRNRLLPEGTFRGWLPEWFAGFPAYYFYFPLPGLAAAFLGFLVPPPLALRIVAFGPVLILPWVLWAFGRWTGLSRIGVMAVVLLGALYLQAGSPILGGNVTSTVAGEFSYGWSLAFAMLYLGRMGRDEARDRRDDPGGWRAGLLLTAAILSHVLPALAAIVASSFLLFQPRRRRMLLSAWATAAGLSAVWTVPMLVRLPFATDLGWAWQPTWGDFLPLHLLLVLPAALMGLRALSHRPALQMLILAGLFSGLMAIAPQTLVLRGRLLPVYSLGFYVLAGAGVAEAVRLRRSRAILGSAALALAIAPPLLGAAARGTASLRESSARVVTGLDARPGAEELDSLQRRLRDLPAGRLHWEFDAELPRWGGTYAFTHLPLTTEHSALTGLLKESAPISTTVAAIDALLAASPPSRPDWWWSETGRPWDPSRALELLSGLGVRYLVTVSEETTAFLTDDLHREPVARYGDLTLFDLGAVPYVMVVCAEAQESAPARASLEEAWLESWRPGQPWPVQGPVLDDGTCAGVGTSTVSDIVTDPGRISFRTESVGAPHLVQASYFPNWKASGAHGPILAGPGLMVVVPTGETVALEFDETWVERVGWAITCLTALTLLVMGLRPSARRPR